MEGLPIFAYKVNVTCCDFQQLNSIQEAIWLQFDHGDWSRQINKEHLQRPEIYILIDIFMQ